jgi:branched-chain amino acid transport system substrate-binding protein
MAAVLAAFLLSSCGADPATPLPPAPDRSLRIVSSLPYKGSAAMQADLMRDGIDLAIEEHRAVLPAWAIEHVALDGGDEETGETSNRIEMANARAAAGDDSLLAYIGPYTSGATMVSLPILNQAGLLQALPVATWPGLTQSGWGSGEPGRYYPTGAQTMLRLIPPDSVQARVAARKAHELGATSALVLADESDYSKGMAATFEEEAARLNMRVLRVQVPADSRASWTAPTQPVDAIFFAPSSLSIALAAAQKIAEDEPRVGVFTTDILLSERLSIEARAKMEGWYVVFNGDPTPGGTEGFAEFSERFQRRFGVPPSQYAANAYDLTAAVLEATSRTGVDRQKVAEAVLTGTYDGGVGGPLTFQPNGDRQGGSLALYRLVAGEFTLSEEIPAP